MRKPHADPEQQLENCRRDLAEAREHLSEALEQQTATADVLRVISSSPGELQPVFQALLENATKLCEASYGGMWLCEGDAFRGAAFHGDLPAAFIEQYGTPFRPSPETALGRVARTHKPVNIADAHEYRAYLDGDPFAVAGIEVAGIRTFFAVPMRKENELVGAIGIYRKEMRPFTDKQIELVTTFADQAAIAIENVRLFDEIQDKNRQLAEASEHKSQFVSSMSHELRTPLNAIIGLTDMLVTNAARFGTEKAMEPLQRVNRAGTHLLGLINQVLGLSKIEAASWNSMRRRFNSRR